MPISCGADSIMNYIVIIICNNIIDNDNSVYEIRKQRLQQSPKEPIEPKMSQRVRRIPVNKPLDSPVSIDNSESINSTNKESKEHIINDSIIKSVL